MKIAITAESTIDLTNELKEKYGIKTVPFGLVLGEKEALDGEISTEELFKFTEETKKLPKTNAVNEYQYEEFFNEILKEYDYVIHFSLSSSFSSACANAQNVAKRLNNVSVINTQSLSTGIALLAIYACELRDKGTAPKKIVELVEKRIPSVQASFIIEKLDYLRKGGRCSALQLLGANLLKLRPQILVANGKMTTGKKFRGNYDKCVKEYYEDILSRFNNPDLSKVFITYTTATPTMLNDARELLKARGFKQILETTAGCTIASHCGEHCIGILYINDGAK